MIFKSIEASTELLLRRPLRPLQPLPVPIASLTNVPASNAIWRWYRGKLAEDDAGIVVEEGEEEDASNLACMGFFGQRRRQEG